ncbi:MAG: heat-inducible transcriptional repressor HrcA [Chloroflexota bacterium]
MAGMLMPRKGVVLKAIIEQFIRTGTPVASLDVTRLYHLGVSPATVRNEVAWLKKEGFLLQPHTSAGSVPSDKGYRYYVNSLLDVEEISAEEQRRLRHMFHQVEMELEEWMGLAACLLAQLVNNVALVVPPRTARARLRRLHLVSVHSKVALLVLVLQDGRLRRQLLTFEDEITQDQLDTICNRLNAIYGGLTRARLKTEPAELSPQEARVLQVAAVLMATEDEREYEEPRLEGLRRLLGQPEFVHSDKALDIMDVLETRALVRGMMAQVRGGDVSVVIGEENPNEALRDLSLVVSRYGVPGEFTGAIGVVGPRRMPYSRSISSVRFLAALLGELAAELYSGSYRGTQ